MPTRPPPPPDAQWGPGDRSSSLVHGLMAMGCMRFRCCGLCTRSPARCAPVQEGPPADILSPQRPGHIIPSILPSFFSFRDNERHGRSLMSVSNRQPLPAWLAMWMCRPVLPKGSSSSHQGCGGKSSQSTFQEHPRGPAGTQLWVQGAICPVRVTCMTTKGTFCRELGTVFHLKGLLSRLW